jgi:hypothetical protein
MEDEDDNESLKHLGKKFARRVVSDYDYLRYKMYTKESTCRRWHTCATAWFELFTDAALDEAKSCTDVATAMEKMREVFALAKKVLCEYESPAARKAYTLKTVKVPYVSPEPLIPLGSETYREAAAKLSFTKLLARLLQNDPLFRKLILAKSDEWKKGELHMKKADQYTDITDGEKCRNDPDLMRKATADEHNVVRIGMQLHNDDATMVNPIGTKRGDRKYSITSCAVINVPLHMRLSQDYMFLLSIVAAWLLKEKGGLAWSITGIDWEGKQVMNNTLAHELRTRVPVKLPNDENPGGDDVEVVLHIIFIVASADWLAAQSLGYTPESTSATYPCGECMWVSKAARKRARARDGESSSLLADSSFACGAPRTHADLAATAQRLKTAGLSKTALKEQMSEAGMNKLHCALEPQRVPGADSVADTPPDIMHLYGCGVSRTEGAHMLRVLFDPKKNYADGDAWRKLNVNISKLNLPRGKRISKLYAQRQGKKMNEMHLDLNAEETLLFVMHSHTLVQPLLTSDGEEHPAWLSWLAHRAVVQKALQHAFSGGDPPELTRLIETHLSLFESVDEYDGLERPKHHFQLHLSRALRRYGPLRGFWCMPWEAYLQERTPRPSLVACARARARALVARRARSRTVAACSRARAHPMLILRVRPLCVCVV